LERRNVVGIGDDHRDALADVARPGPAKPGRVIADAIGRAEDLEAAVDSRKHGAQRARDARARAHADQRGVQPLDV